MTAALGVIAIVFLLRARQGLRPLLLRMGLGERMGDILAKMGPAMIIVAATAAVAGLGLDEKGVKVLGAVPQGLPEIGLPPIEMGLWTKLLVPSFLICIVGYVESISVALTLAAKRRQRVDPDQELIALGMANLGAAVSSGFPVTGASRSSVNFDAGAQTPAAGAFTAVGVAIATLFLTPWLFFLPKAVLGAIIIVVVLSLVDVGAIRRTRSYSRPISQPWREPSGSLAAGIEAGLLVGWAVDLPAPVSQRRDRTWPSSVRSRGRRISATSPGTRS